MENKRYGKWEYAVYAVILAVLVMAYLAAWEGRTFVAERSGLEGKGKDWRGEAVAEGMGTDRRE